MTYEDLPRLISLMTGDEKHDASSHSTLDVIWVLYDQILSVAPDRIDDPDRDWFILSKGHGPLAYYATLCAKGFIDERTIKTFGEFDSPLGHHPDRVLIPGVEISSGSLGHGLPMAVGVSEGLRIKGLGGRVVCLVGDGELDEGSNFEAIQYAGRAALTNLTVVALDNHSATYGWPGGISKRFEVEGWTAEDIDGRDHTQIAEALSPKPGPHLVVAEVDG